MENDTRPVALVLGAAVRSDGTPSQALRLRAEHAARLFQSGRLSGIVASGGAHTPGGQTEAAAILRICHAWGVPDRAIHLEEQARDTAENLILSAPLIRKIAGGRVLIVTDPWHAPRAVLVARWQGLSATSAAVPLAGRRVTMVLRGTLREMIAFAGYWISRRGR